MATSKRSATRPAGTQPSAGPGRGDTERGERLHRAAFVAAVTLLAFAGGLVAGTFELPPGPSVRALYDETRRAAMYWENDLGIEPTRHLVDAYPGPRRRFAVHDPAGLGGDLVLVAGLTPEREALNSVLLLDAAGTEVHAWPIDYAALDPEGRPPQNVFLHGMAPLADGSIVVNFDAGDAMARIGACGEVIWARRGEYHHVVSPAADGTLWTWRGGHTIVQLDAAAGGLLREIDLVADIMTPGNLQGVLAIRSEAGEGDAPKLWRDPFHPNHVEALPPELAEAFPMFEAGDLLISLRSLNLVGVVDPERRELKWWQIGPWHRQHHPRFLPDGTILVYNNNMHFGASQILSVDPATGDTEVVFEGSEANPFYSWRRGKQQPLPGGGLVITESERGRAFEVTADGTLVWEYNNIYDDTRNGVLGKAMRLPADFFAADALSCGADRVTEGTRPPRGAG